MEWEKAGTVPEHVFKDFCKHNMLLPNLPAPLPVEWLKRLGIHDILGVKVEEWDYLHTGIYCDEVWWTGHNQKKKGGADYGDRCPGRVWLDRGPR
jgi:acyl-CoA dehydrogenase